MISFRKFWNGITLKPSKSTTQVNQPGDLDTNTTDGKINFYNGVAGTASPVVTESHAATLTNKTLSGDDNTFENIPIDALDELASNSSVVTDVNGHLTYGNASSTEIGYLGGLTGPIQTQLNGKQNAGNYITDLNGDVTASGPGSATATISNLLRSKIAAESANNVVINGAGGFLTSEPHLAKSRGGTGLDNSAVNFPSSGTLTTNDGFQTLVNKTIGDAPTFTQISTPTTPGGIGQKLYPKSDGNFYTLSATGVETQIGSGASAGSGKNYLTAYTASTSSGVANIGNGNFELGSTTGWDLAHTTVSSATPVTVGNPGYPYISNHYVFTVSGANATIGAIYNNNSQNFTVTQTIASKNILVCTGTGAPNASGFLTKNSGTGDSIINFSAFLNTSPAGTVSLTPQSAGSQIAGAYSAQVLSGGPAVGDMLLSSPFFIDQEDQAKVLTFSFYYKPVLGGNFSGTSANSFAVYIYDCTQGIWIQPAGCYSMVQGTGTGYASGTFQASSSSTQYQIAIVLINNTGSYGYIIDDVVVGPQRAPMGPAMSDWQSYPPIFTNLGIVSNNNAIWRRVGDSVEVRGSVTCGTTVASFLSVSLPPGVAYNTANLVNQASVLGTWWGAVSNNTFGSNNLVGNIYYDSSLSTTVLCFANGASSSALSHLNASPTFASGNQISYQFKVQVSGWSSNSIQSSDTDTRVVGLIANSPSSAITGSVTDIVWGTTTKDTHASFNGTTYTVPVSGLYLVSGAFRVGASNYPANNYAEINVTQNGTTKFDSVGRTFSGAAESVPTINGLLDCKAGDLIKFQINAQGTAPFAWNGGASGNWMQIFRLSGPAVVAATESVNCSYGISTAINIANTATPMVGDTRLFDTHNAYNSSTGVFTAPVSGKYRVSYQFFSNSAALTATNRWEGAINKNGSSFRSMPAQYADANRTAPMAMAGTCLVPLNAGETLSLNTDQNFGVSLTLSGSTTQNYIDIERIGN